MVDAAADMITVEVAAGSSAAQVLVSVLLPAGSSAGEAVLRADLSSRLEDLEVDWAQCQIGIFGQPCRPERVLAEGDRVEVYRPLKADPKEVRRQMAEMERAARRK